MTIAVAESVGRSVRAAHAAPAEGARALEWYACRTRARAEKMVNSRLAAVGLESYLPLIERERQWADRRKRVAFPLFSGYVFARFKLTELWEVLRTPGLATVVGLNGSPTPVREEELRSVHALVEGVNRTGILPSAADCLAPGQAVVVVRGPFQGMCGTLLQTRGSARVVVALPAIKLAVGVEMDRACLRPAPS